ncbi:MAG: transketolase family protein [Lachnospiraceae bacterium]|nr:transketolase family protein [Lachnospiraceae bacterium]
MEEMRETFGKYLATLGSEYDNMYVLDADLKTSTRTVLFEDVYPKRFVQCGIAEQNMVGISAGLALEGKIPVICTFAAFLSQRVLDQVNTSLAYPHINVKLAAAYSGIYASMCGATHQSLEDLAIMRAMPGMYVAAPGDNRELQQVMKAAMEHEGPVYYRVNRGAPDSSISDGHTFSWGKGHVLREGDDITIVSTGITSQWALEAANKLSSYGVSARVLHMPSIKPFDEELLIKAAKETGQVFTVENHSVIGGLGGLVAEVLSYHHPTRIVRIGIQDHFCETAADDVLTEHYGIGCDAIVERILEK